MLSYVVPTASIAHLAGVWTVVVVTTHRYIAVNYPHRVKKLASLRVARYQASSALCGTYILGNYTYSTCTYFVQTNYDSTNCLAIYSNKLTEVEAHFHIFTLGVCIVQLKISSKTAPIICCNHNLRVL